MLLYRPNGSSKLTCFEPTRSLWKQCLHRVLSNTIQIIYQPLYHTRYDSISTCLPKTSHISPLPHQIPNLLPNQTKISPPSQGHQPHSEFGGEAIRSDLDEDPASDGNVSCESDGGAGRDDRRCEKCGERFTFLNRLLAHLRLAHGIERPFKCPHCDKAFGQRFMLNSHVKKRHGPKLVVACAHCSFSTLERDKLERHIRLIHENDLPRARVHDDYFGDFGVREKVSCRDGL